MALTPTDCLILVWLFALGGTVGSFLNVVVYRLPAGKSLVSPPSHCPACDTPIRWHDNVPIFGWMWLRGRCRDCGVKISARYLAVEAAAAGLFVLLGWLEPIAGGVNLPIRPVPVADGVLLPPWSPLSGQLFGIYAYHVLLCCTLLAAALVAWDDKPVPGRLFGPVLLVGAAAPLVWPWLHPVPVAGSVTGWLAGIVDTAAGAFGGALAGWLGATAAESRQRVGVGFGVVSVGVVLGWQAGLVLGVFAATVAFLSGGDGPRRDRFLKLPTLGWLAIATLAWIVGWSRLSGLLPPGELQSSRHTPCAATHYEQNTAFSPGSADGTRSVPATIRDFAVPLLLPLPR